MADHTFQCPSCGAPLLPRGSAAVIRCTHCLTSIIVPEELRQDSATEQWSTLLFDNFTSNEDNYWLVGSQSSDYFDPVNRTIADGRYRWEANVSKANSISKVWLGDFRVSDFHLLANSKHILGTRANSGWGVIFGVQDNQNYYWFRMTDSKYFAVSVAENSQWRDIIAWTRTDTIKPNGVNQLEVLAQDAHFTFLINGEIVSDATDDRYRKGLVGLAIEGYTQGEKLVFDFLDFTLRGAA
ncbi:MAG TPA: hypothetical protein VFG81_17260 [Anaerolineales bacterium]|nr:hypothetical protein [Anaerolineales bacterium]